MKLFKLKRAACIFLSFVFFISFIFTNPVPAKADSVDYVNIMHKISTARPNFPIRYNFSLKSDSDIFFDIRTNERTTVGLAIKNQSDEIAIKSDTLPSTDPNWKYDSGSGIYQNTHTMHLPAGNYILELNFETEVNFDLTVSLISPGAKLNYSKLTLTKGFTKQLKVTGGTIKSCTSNKPGVASVSKTGKITAKKTGTAKITVKLTNGKSLTCRVTVKSNAYSAKKIDISDIEYNTYTMKVYKASFDSKGNLIVNFTVVNNSYGKLASVPKFKITIKDSKKTVVASYKKTSYSVNVKSYSSKDYKVVIPKSSLKKSAAKIDLRNCTFTISGDNAYSTL